MINLRTCLSRNSVFRKFKLLDSSAPINSRIFSYFLRPYHQEINEKIEDRLRSEDSVTKDYRIIYRAPYVTYLKLTYAFTSVTSSIVIPLVGSAIMTSGIGNYPIMLGDITVINNSFEFTAFIGVTMLVSGQLGYVVFKYPFRIYHNSTNGKYIAIYQHLLPWKKHKEEFCAGEVKRVKKSFSIWQDCLYEIKKKRSIILMDHFYIPQDFNDMVASNEKNK